MTGHAAFEQPSVHVPAYRDDAVRAAEQRPGQASEGADQTPIGEMTEDDRHLWEHVLAHQDEGGPPEPRES